MRNFVTASSPGVRSPIWLPIPSMKPSSTVNGHVDAAGGGDHPGQDSRGQGDYEHGHKDLPQRLSPAAAELIQEAFHVPASFSVSEGSAKTTTVSAGQVMVTLFVQVVVVTILFGVEVSSLVSRGELVSIFGSEAARVMVV